MGWTTSMEHFHLGELSFPSAQHGSLQKKEQQKGIQCRLKGASQLTGFYFWSIPICDEEKSFEKTTTMSDSFRSIIFFRQNAIPSGTIHKMTFELRLSIFRCSTLRLEHSRLRFDYKFDCVAGALSSEYVTIVSCYEGV